MSAPSSQGRAPRVSRRNCNLLIAAVAVVVIGVAGVGGFGIYYLFLRAPGPASVEAGPPVIPSGAPVAAPASLDGQWAVNTTLGSIDDASASFAGYRVQEQLVGIGGHIAVGRTPKVTGSLTIQGSVVDNVQITADLTALVSDDPTRDIELQTKAIDTNQFPAATFTTIGPTDLGTLPADGQTIKVTAKGTLTLHGVTRPVDIDLQARRQGGIVAVTGSTDITFTDYGFAAPTSAVVLTVAGSGTMEFHLLFTHA